MIPTNVIHGFMSQTHLAGINLNLLVALDALLRTQSVTLAAGQLGVTQSAASRSLAQLRGLFDDPILVRQGSRMVPTPRADALVGPLRDALDRLGGVLEAGVPFDPATTTRRFRLAAPDVIAPMLLPRIGLSWPTGAGIDIAPLRTGSVFGDLETGVHDLALGPAVDRSGLACELLTELPFAVAMRQGHPASRDLDLDTYTACRHVLVNPLDSEGDRSVVGRSLAELGRSRSVAVRVPSFLAAPWALLQSDYLLTAPLHFLTDLASRLPLTVVGPPLELPSFRIHALWHRRWEAEPGHVWLRGQLASSLATLPLWTRTSITESPSGSG